MEHALLPANQGVGGEGADWTKKAANQDGAQTVQGAVLCQVSEDFS